jgi:hypothetical protein
MRGAGAVCCATTTTTTTTTTITTNHHQKHQQQEGLLLDDATRGLSAHLVTYNAELRVFGAARLDFAFQAGGNIKVRRASGWGVSWLRQRWLCK